MNTGLFSKLRDTETLRRQLLLEAEGVFVVFPMRLLGSDAVPRLFRYWGLKAFGAKLDSPNIMGGLTIAGSPGNVHIGEDTFVNRDALFEPAGRITLGRGVQVGPQAAFITSHHPRLPDGTIAHHAEGRPIVVGDGAWIGARAMILPGVTVARDVVIAGGAVVTKDCDVPGGTYGGVPAKLVKGPSPEYLATHGGTAVPDSSPVVS